MYIYYPSCNFSAASPATAKKVKAYFEKQMPVAGCCRVDKREISPADIALYICQACRETLEDKVKTQSMWEYLDALKDFNFPNLNGQKFYVQDCWRDRNHPEIHEAVRSLLKKMHAEVIEIEHNREKSIFCGNLHYETDDRVSKTTRTPHCTSCPKTCKPLSCSIMPRSLTPKSRCCATATAVMNAFAWAVQPPFTCSISLFLKCKDRFVSFQTGNEPQNRLY